MPTEVLLSLSDDAYRRAVQLAGITGSQVSEVLTDVLTASLADLPTSELNLAPIAAMSDGDVLELAQSQMEPGADRRHSELLDKQQARKLDDSERAELVALTQAYQVGLMRKATALSEAVRRGIHPPLEP